MHQIGVAAVVVGRRPIGSLTKTAQVGGEHHEAPFGQLLSVVIARRVGRVETADQ